jgi:tetratricopeptide (TPR) repeat protein
MRQSLRRLVCLQFSAQIVAGLALVAVALGLGACASMHPADDATPPALDGQIAPRLQNLGTHSHPITTRSPRAQLFFDQGLVLAYGFNHLEAARSFREAARLDPDAAMAWWGQALVLGPNINAPMRADDEPRAFELVQNAIRLADGVSERERAYIHALARRYSADPNPDRATLDRAYAEAMGELHRRYPDDLDAATLYVEALMDLRPWNYWTPDGQPYPETLEILRALESILAREPAHPGANHLYIHAVEATRPDLAEGAADRLLDLVPGAGHLQHLPSHIYVRVGRFADASAANRKAIAADVDYVAQCRAQGIYPLTYYPHNIHFLWWSASWEGRSQEAIASAREVAARTREHLHEIPEWGHVFPVTPLYALARFGRWEEILAEPRPPDDQPFSVGMWHYARGLALARTRRLRESSDELERLRALAADPALEGRIVGGNEATRLLDLATTVLAGELAAERGDLERAIAELHRGVLLEEGLTYIEPADWYYPVRQSLGAVLLQAGRFDEAEAVYWQDLRGNPENGWSLFGLAQALRAQREEQAARAVEERFRRVWAHADVELPASRF